MIYVGSDLHGEYDLFVALLEKINFSDSDKMIICGDMIDKGKNSIKLAKYIFSKPNIQCILGNHEYAFLKYYRSLMEKSPSDFGGVLEKLRAYFPDDGHLLDYETVDAIEALPLYFETESFLCVHSGVPLSEDGRMPPLSEVSTEEFVFDRRFKDPKVTHSDPRCVFFGHTETNAVCGKNIILGYLRHSQVKPKDITDFYKVHLDTGAWNTGVMACICVDTLKAYYVYKNK